VPSLKLSAVGGTTFSAAALVSGSVCHLCRVTSVLCLDQSVISAELLQ